MNKISKFPTVKLELPNNADYTESNLHKLNVDDINDIFTQVINWPNNVEPLESNTTESTIVEFIMGYGCSETNTLYVFSEESLFSIDKDKYTQEYTVELNNTEYTFDIVKK